MRVWGLRGLGAVIDDDCEYVTLFSVLVGDNMPFNDLAPCGREQYQDVLL